MRLPGIGPTQGMQSKARKDVSSPLAEVNARNAAFAALGGTAASFMNEYEIKETRRQIQEKDLSMVRAMTEVEQRYGGKREFDIMDQEYLDDPLMTEALGKIGVTELDQKVPSYRLMPELRAAARQAAIDNLGKDISATPAREKWINDQEMIGVQGYHRDVVRAQADQQVYMDVESMKEIEQFKQEGNYEGALVALKGAGFDPKVEAKVEAEIMNEKQAVRYDEVLERSTRLDEMNAEQLVAEKTLLKEHRKELIDNVPEHTSDLSQKEQKGIAAQLTARINAINTLGSKTAEGSLAVYRDEGRKLETMALSGRISNPSRYGQVENVLLSSDKMSDKILGMDMGLARRGVGGMMKYDAGTTIERSALRQSVQNSLDDTSLTTGEAYVYSKLEQAIDTSDRELNNDAVKFMRERDIAPVRDFDMGDVVGSIQNRDVVGKIAQFDYGISGAYLEDAELPTVMGEIQNMNSDEKAQFYGEVLTGFGGDMNKANAFFEPFKKAGIGVNAAMAGQKHMMGDTIASGMITRGAELLKPGTGSPEIVKGVSDKLNSLLNKDVGNAYQYNLVEQGAVKSSTLAVYAALSMDVGDLSGKPDTGRMQQALDIVTGGTINYEGAKFGAPIKGMTSESFGNFMDNITPTYLDGVHSNYDQAEVLDKLQNGQIRLVATGHNKFNLVVQASNTTIPDTNGRSYEFSVHQPTETVAGQNAITDRAAELAKRQREIELRTNHPEIFQPGPGEQPARARKDITAPDWMIKGVENAAKWVDKTSTKIFDDFDKKIAGGN